MDFNKNTWNSILFVAELIYSRKVDNWIFWKKWQDSSLGEARRNEVRYTSWAGKPKKISLKKWQDSSAGESARLIPGRSSVRSRVLLFFSSEQSNERSERQKINRRVVVCNFLRLRLMRGLFYNFWVVLFFSQQFCYMTRLFVKSIV